ncbi:30S ribosomal protein S16 [Patescibacteria group bacterium]|nr:30S ribosomal protein S16 [Patescibacteria group bacterium]
MSVTIRLSRIGKRNAPAFKIVVSNTRDKRNGRFLDMLGHYNPSHNPESFSYDKKKYAEWVGKGALITAAVKNLISGTYKFTKYEPKKNVESKQENTPAEKNLQGENS